jgi:hypothetical protein
MSFFRRLAKRSNGAKGKDQKGMAKHIEKLGKKERKKLLKAAKPESAGPLAMQPPRNGDVADARRDQPDDDNTANSLGRRNVRGKAG